MTDAEDDWLEDYEITSVAAIPSEKPGKMLLTSIEVVQLAVNAVLGAGATDHARMRWPDDHPAETGQIRHPFTTEGKWIEEEISNRVEILLLTKTKAAREFKIACMEGHIWGYAAYADGDRWFRLNRAYWNFHKECQDDPAIVRVAVKVGLDAKLADALILFSADDASAWIAAKLDDLSEHRSGVATRYREEVLQAKLPPQRKPGRPSVQDHVVSLYRARLEAGTANQNTTREAETILELMRADQAIPARDIPGRNTVYGHIVAARKRLEKQSN